MGGVRRCGVGLEGLGQGRGPGLPTSHLVPCHGVHHVHLTEEKGGGLGPMTPLASDTTKGRNQGAERVYPSLPCTTSWRNSSPGLPPPGGAQVQPVLCSLRKEQVSQISTPSRNTPRPPCPGQPQEGRPGDPPALLLTAWG